MLTPFDDYPVHQTPEPITHPATGDPNHYDRYFFNGYEENGEFFLGAAMGHYPNRNVIDAAKEAGVKHLFYTSIQRSTHFVMQQVTESDLATEAYLKASGLVYTILKNGYYFEGLEYLIGSEVPDREILFPAGEGKIAFVKRTELAAATAALLTSEGHDNQEYTLSGSEAYSFHDIAREFSALAGRPIAYKSSELAPYIAQKVAAGFPEVVANFFAQWGAATKHGMLAGTDNTVERLLGRRPTSLQEYLKTTYF